jgi:hypothetical protein
MNGTFISSLKDYIAMSFTHLNLTKSWSLNLPRSFDNFSILANVLLIISYSKIVFEGGGQRGHSPSHGSYFF